MAAIHAKIYIEISTQTGIGRSNSATSGATIWHVLLTKLQTAVEVALL